MSKFSETQKAIKENDPPIEVDQRWICLNDNGEVYRRIRIIAKHPDGDWIICDEPAKMKTSYYGELRRCPEFNLRYVMQLENNDLAT